MLVLASTKDFATQIQEKTIKFGHSSMISHKFEGMPLGTRLIGSGFPQQLKRCVSFSLYAAKFPHSLIIRLHMELEGSAKLHDRSFLLHCEFYPVLFTKSMKPEDTGPQIDGKGLVIDEWFYGIITGKTVQQPTFWRFFL